MTQQPLLVYDEVVELLKEALSPNETWHNAFMELVWNSDLNLCGLDYNGNKLSFNAINALLQHCANILRDRGIFVYLKVAKFMQKLHYYLLIAGECGVLYEKLKNQRDYLYDLSLFIEDYEDELPRKMVAKNKKINYYAVEIESKLLFWLRMSYIKGDKEALKSLCEEAWEFAEEVATFLESIIDLRRVYAITTML
jgi:hypothetical protein